MRSVFVSREVVKERCTFQTHDGESLALVTQVRGERMNHPMLSLLLMCVERTLLRRHLHERVHGRPPLLPTVHGGVLLEESSQVLQRYVVRSVSSSPGEASTLVTRTGDV